MPIAVQPAIEAVLQPRGLHVLKNISEKLDKSEKPMLQ
jgi:hypothetical protein